MKKKWPATIIKFAGILLLIINAPAHAQRLTYDNQSQVIGAAAASPEGGRVLLEKLFTYCSTYGASVRIAGQQALKDWKTRHQSLLDENVIVKRELFDSINKSSVPEKDRNTFKHMFEVVLPNTIEAQFKAYIAPIEGINNQEAKADLCMSYVKSVADGKWDLRNNDPVVYTFLNDRIAAHHKQAK
ncbi:hypothetical protein [Undibacterium sp. TS12]|uniref:hypothetical protein n=1 Tax=Undibacterium sp. TS12 TaxID=2908202 RepID=UPI001F4C9B29|nr:hypothetical protein [Undibacterium sp. TS12]MCH8619527.1 hypothetical protein [Undibacterium sp. TS12]